MSQTYIQNLVYHERLSQMEEVTHQMFRSLEDVIDNHWDDVDVQCNYLAYMPMETTDDLFSYLEKLSELSNYKESRSSLLPWTLPDIIIPSMAAWGCCGE